MSTQADLPLVPIYWALAFIVAAAIPQIANLTSFVGAACILQFTYVSITTFSDVKD